MQTFLSIILITLLAWLGSKLLGYVHVPAATVIGPMFLIGTIQVFGGNLQEFPRIYVSICQIIIGFSIGLSINRQKIRDLKSVWKPAVLIALWTIISTFVIGIILIRFTDNIITAMLAAAPGGISEMSILALSYDCKVSIVSLYQFTRIVVILSLIPIIARFSYKHATAGNANTSTAATVESYKTTMETNERGRIMTFRSLAVWVLGISGALLFMWLKVPSGAFLGSALMIAVGNVSLNSEVNIPRRFFKLAQIGVGASVGLKFTPSIAQELHKMILPIIIFSLVVVLSNFAIGWIIKLLTKWDSITSLLSSSPGGLSQMAIVGDELGADVVKISVLQTVRLVTIVSAIPVMLQLVKYL